MHLTTVIHVQSHSLVAMNSLSVVAKEVLFGLTSPLLVHVQCVDPYVGGVVSCRYTVHCHSWT